MTTRNRTAHLQQVRTVLAMGSNMGDRLAFMRQGLEAIRAIPGVSVRAVSSLYDTDHVYLPGTDLATAAPQDNHLNAVVLISTSLTGHELLAHTLTIESCTGRTRHERWGARTLDIDLVVHGEDHFTDQVLTLPHPRVAERAFVLIPWLEVEPRAMIARLGPVRELLRRLPERDRTGVRLWSPPAGSSWPRS